MSDRPRPLAEAESLRAAGRIEEAAAVARALADAEPDRGDAWHLLGRLALDAGRPEEARGYLARAVERDGANPAVHNDLGLALAELGDAASAADSFRLAALFAPDSAEVHSNLGAALRGLGDWPAAEASLRRALALQPGLAAAHHNLGLVHRAWGRLDVAVDEFRAALAADPAFGSARVELAALLRSLGRGEEADGLAATTAELPASECALALLAEGRDTEAEAAARESLRQQPDRAEALNTLAAALLRRGRFAEAEPHARRAIERAPGLVEARSNLGQILLGLGRYDEAATTFDGLIAGPDPAGAHLQRGRVELARGRPEDAARHFEAALAHRPDHADALASLGVARHRLGDRPGALECLDRATRVEPRTAASLTTIGAAYLDIDRRDGAESYLRAALHAQPGQPAALRGLADLLADAGRTDEASSLIEDAIRRAPSDRLRLRRATLLPPIYASMADLDARRDGLINDLDRLQRDGVRVDVRDETLPTLFYLAYQGRDDRPIHEAMASLVVPPDDPPLLPGRSGKVRVGFLSRHLKNHTIGHLLRGTIARLDRDEFSAVVLSASADVDEISTHLRQVADEYAVLPLHLPAARAAVRERGVDILVYTDIGMDAFTYTLAFSRLAPVQCAFWGHPVTTGLATIDYFLSSEGLDTPEARDHYTEALVRLPRLPVYYFRPPPVGPARRSDLGLPESAHLYACPQSLFKFHPDFDAVLAAILRRDPAGRVVLLDGWHPAWGEALRDRFARTMPDVLDRVLFLPRLGRDDFLRLNAAADVLLDPLHFGGGNTSYEAFAVGTPIVTWPSPFLRGRITAALYAKMGIDDFLARSHEDYVEIALRLGTDPDAREAARRLILERAGTLFEDESGVRALEDFFRSVAPR